MTPFDLSVLLFLQLAFILAVIRVVGWLGKHIGQPQVVCEMIAGVVMGPSLFGLIAPELQGQLFPKESRAILYTFAQVGLVLYMFLIGAEFDVGLIRKRIRSAASVSLAGIMAPFALGCGIAAMLYMNANIFTPKVTLLEGMLFLGASMSITAFPMLARIIHERGLSGTSLGTLALAAGSIDDATAWCVLAVVLASFSGDATIAILAIGGGILYTIGALTLIRSLLQRFLARLVERTGTISGGTLAAILVMVMLGAWYTDKIGIYAVFGAFIMGAAMPRGRVTHELQRLIEPLTTNFLLPLFFVYSGLNTRIGLVSTPALWGITAVIVLAACLGKGVACWGAARLNGEPNREAVAIGTLMNARGLMELIILNIGLDRGIITPTLFTIMVIMAIVTTLMASPIFELVYGRTQSRARAVPAGSHLSVES